MKKIIFITVITLLFVNASFTNKKKANIILKKVDGNLSFNQVISYRKIINIEPNRNRKEFVLKFFKKDQDKVATLFLSPSSDKGRTSLRIEDNMWLYIPSAGKPIRITSLQSAIGGVFNNSDIMRLDYHVEYNAVKMTESKKYYTLYLKAKTNQVAYERLEMKVNKKLILPEYVKCFSSTGILIKTLSFKRIKNFGNGLVRPSVIETTSPLQKGYKSIMVIGKMMRAKLSNDMFTLSYMSILSNRGN